MSFLTALFVLGWLSWRAAGQAPCRATLYVPPNGNTFNFYNPNYPRAFQPGTNCFWLLYTDERATIRLNCPSVNLNGNGGWSCADLLSIRGTDQDGQYCRPFSAVSNGNRLVIQLESNSLYRGGTFQCRVQAVADTSCDCGWSYRERIVGGVETGVNEFPNMAALIDASIRQQVCGASIISPRYVLTAAHCFDFLRVATTGVLVGEHDLSTGSETNVTRLYRARRVIRHPGYTGQPVDDIALVEVDGEIAFSQRVGPVCLPFNRAAVPQLGEQLTVIGWGLTSFGGPKSDVLQKTNIRAVDPMRCQQLYPNVYSNATQICTYEEGKDACQMDSGGPVLYEDHRSNRLMLVGITSYGNRCGGPDPSVSTKVYPYLSWIRERIGSSEPLCVKP